MIVDLTQTFFEEAGSSRTAYTQSNWHASLFIKNSTSHLADLSLLDTKLTDIQKVIRTGARFEKQSLTNKMFNVKEHLKLCQQNIKRLKSQQVDIKSKQHMAQKLKESILIAMELRLLTSTFRFKEFHLSFAKLTSGKDAVRPERQINLSRSHFLQPTQTQILEQVAARQYKQIQKSINQISQMYKQTMHVVRMHELLIENIEGHIDDTDQNVQGGRRNLSELNSKEQKNRQFIYKVFGILYFVVFVYIVLLS